MSTLHIADLAESNTLGCESMTAVRGGIRALESRSLYWGSLGDQVVTVNPVQSINQFQWIENAVGNNVANFGVFAPKISPTLNQNAPLDVSVFT